MVSIILNFIIIFFYLTKIFNLKNLNKIFNNLEWLNTGLILIVCILKEQAELLIKLKSFQIDLSFKRVKGDINEFEINMYDEKHKLGKYFL